MLRLFDCFWLDYASNITDKFLFSRELNFLSCKQYTKRKTRRKEQALKPLKEYIYITLGAFMLAVAVNCFLVPVKISTGGISGIGTVLYYFFNIPIFVTTLVANAVLFLAGFRVLEKKALVKTVYGILSLSAFLALTEYLPKYTDDIFIASVFGGVIAGFGVGLTISRGASTGGSDFAALMLNKMLPHISVTAFIIAIDMVIIVISGILFENYTLTFYSALCLYIGNKVTDSVLVRGGFAKKVLIISEKSADIASAVQSRMHRGVTGLYTRGMYAKTDGITLMCVVRAKEIPSLMAIVSGIDDRAFTVVSDVRNVLGEGFRG